MPMVVFPEGERSPTGEMLPFRPGAFYVAVEAQADIVPVAILGTYEAFPIGSAHLRPRRLQLIIGDAIPVAGYTRGDLSALAERTQRAVAELCQASRLPSSELRKSPKKPDRIEPEMP
jgi:1-acyl-sn-glycerol-3-phosphate acyltransferase